VGRVAPTAPACFGALAPICDLPMPSGAAIINASVNTDTDPRCVVRGSRCVIAGTSVSAQGDVQVTAGRSLVLIATTGDLSVSGTLDASSTRAGRRGAAANDPSCTTGNGVVNNSGGAVGVVWVHGTLGTGAGQTSPAPSLH